MTAVGVFEAKSHLSDLLLRVERGEEITLTRHGKPVARLVPPAPATDAGARRAWAEELRQFRRGKDRGATAGSTLPELIAAGRR